MLSFRKFLESNGDSYFDQNALQQVQNQGSKSREILIRMSPKDFLAMAEDIGGPDASVGKGNVDKNQRVADILSSGRPFTDIPHLGFEHDGKGTAWVVSHEGRHRALALLQRGVTEMPVKLISQAGGGGQAIRWGEQSGNNRFDVIKGEWPRILKGESGGEITFPVPDMRNHPV